MKLLIHPIWIHSLLLILSINSMGSAEASPSSNIWLSIHATQPNVPTNTSELTAQIPYNLFGLFLGAVPPEYRIKAKEMEFDLIEIRNGLDDLVVGESFTKLSEGIKLTITKEGKIRCF